MKKYIALFTAAVIAAALTGCSSDQRAEDGNKPQNIGTAAEDTKSVNPILSNDPVTPADNNKEMGVFDGEEVDEDINDEIAGDPSAAGDEDDDSFDEIAIYDPSAAGDEDDDGFDEIAPSSADDGEDFTGDENAVLGGETVQIPNPLIEYKTLADAEAAAGFDFAVPDEIDGNAPTSYIVINGSGIIEVTYGDNTISLRKAAGSGDISGDCNSYTEIGAGVGDVSVTLRENDEKVFSAIWENDGYTYALYSADGISENTATTAIAAAK